jgi:hypothetical protein
MTEHRERISIRAAMPLDGPAILDMLADLASFEGADHHPRLDVTSLERNVFWFCAAIAYRSCRTRIREWIHAICRVHLLVRELFELGGQGRRPHR